MNKEELEAFERLAKDLGYSQERRVAAELEKHGLVKQLEAECQKVERLRNARNEAELYAQAQAKLAEELQHELDEALGREAEPDSYAAGKECGRIVLRHKWWYVASQAWVGEGDVDISHDIFRNADDPNNDPPKLVRVLYTAEEVQAVLGPKEEACSK